MKLLKSLKIFKINYNNTMKNIIIKYHEAMMRNYIRAIKKNKMIRRLRDTTKSGISTSKQISNGSLSPNITFLDDSEMNENDETNNITDVRNTLIENHYMDEVVNWSEKLVQSNNHTSLGEEIYFASVNINLDGKTQRIFRNLIIASTIQRKGKKDILTALKIATKMYLIDSLGFHNMFETFFKECYTMFQWQCNNDLINLQSKVWDFKNNNLTPTNLSSEQKEIRRMCRDKKSKAAFAFTKLNKEIFAK